MNTEILNTDVQDFINSNLKKDLTKLILKGSPFENITMQELAEQITSKTKCREKLPTWFKSEHIFYPGPLHIEQTSSELTAIYKSGLIRGKSLLDLTGGFGVDSVYFSRKVNAVTHCELDPELSEIAAHNFRELGCDNIACRNVNGLEYLRDSNTHYDWIFLDPSRRSVTKKKVFQLEDCIPDLTQHLELLFEHSGQVMVKLSPILDISDTIQKLKYVKNVYIISVKNEVKELIFLLEKKHNGECTLKAVNIFNGSHQVFEGMFPSREQATYSLPKKYLYEPNSSIMKSGLFSKVSNQLKLDKLHVNSHLYTSDELIEFPGRRFVINTVLKFSKKEILRLLPDGKANVTTRNFPISVAQIRKRTGIREGGSHYLFFTTDVAGKHVVIDCVKI